MKKLKIYTTRKQYNKFKLVLGSGFLLGVGTVSLALGLSSCSKNNSDINTTVDTNTEQDVVTTTESQVQPTIENNAEIDSLQIDITNLINEEILSNGVINITEDNKKDEVELITNAYITINASDLSAKSLGSLDQDGELISAEMTEDYMNFVVSLSNSIVISDKDTVIDSSSLFAKDDQGNIIDQNDYEFLQNYLNTVADYNQAIKDGDKALSDEKFAQLNSIKDSILTDTNITKDINLSTLYIVVDSMLLVPNLATSDETKAQLINSIEEACENKITTNEEVDNTMDTEASQGSYESRFLSSTDKLLKAVLDKASEFRSESEIKYSYSNVISNIMSKIDLSKYKAPVITYVEQEIDKQQKISDSKSNATIGDTTTKTAAPGDIPANQIVEETVVITDTTKDANEIPLTEAELQEAHNKGDEDARNDYISGIPQNPNPSVAGKSAEWNKEYASSYNTTYSGFLIREKELEQQGQPVEFSYNYSELQILNDLKSMFADIGLTFDEPYYAQVKEDCLNEGSVKTM